MTCHCSYAGWGNECPVCRTWAARDAYADTLNSQRRVQYEARLAFYLIYRRLR